MIDTSKYEASWQELLESTREFIQKEAQRLDELRDLAERIMRLRPDNWAAPTVRPPALAFDNGSGIPMLARLLENGTPCGEEFRKIHQGPPTLEFYDGRYPFVYEYVGTKQEAIEAGATVLGQFITRRRADLLSDPGVLAHGLILDGGVPAWKISASAMRYVVAWMRDELEKI